MFAINRCWSAVLALAACATFGSARADVNFAAEYMKRLKMYQTVQPIGETPFGENVNLYTGELGFNQTDVELEGTGPTLVLAREYRSQRQYAEPINTMGDWKLSIPRMETMSKGGWQVSTFPDGPLKPVASYARCTQFGKPYDEHNEQSLWWHGYELVTERNDRQQILFRSASFTAKPTGIDAGYGVLTHFPAVTQQNWQFGCLPNTSNGKPGEGFLAVSPDGTRYYFDHLVSAPATTVYEYDPDLTVPIKHFRTLQVLYVTRIEDRFGNYLTYAYDDTRLASITGSDGRKATVLWNPGTGDNDQTVKQIILQPNAAQPRRWNYTYEGGRLRYVQLPDYSYWSFALQESNTLALPTNTCATRTTDDVTGSQAISTIGHPSGLVGSFVMAGKFHARSYVPSECLIVPPSQQYQEDNFPIFSTSSLISKTISGAGIANKTWSYAYSAPVASTTHDSCAQTNTCQDWRTVDVTDPDGDRIRYTLSTRWGALESKLLKTEFFEGASATPLRTDTAEYAAPDSGPFPAVLGGTGQVWQTNSIKSTTWTPVRKRVTVLQGVTFTWSVNPSGQGYAFDAFARPLNVTRSNTLGYSRADDTDYYDNLASWVLGQMAGSTCIAPASCAGIVESKTEYDTNAMPWKTYAFGKLQQTLAYDTTSAVATGQRGTLKTVTDGNNNVTTFANWKRGIPQAITFPATPDQPVAVSKSAQVNDFGLIDWVKDENGFQTSYGYDAMGRLSLIDYPNGDTVNWNDTTIAFAPSPDPKYGLPANHWRRTEATGNSRKVTFFDALWRPVVQETYDPNNSGNTLVQTVTRYDSDGRPTFVSYPQRVFDGAVYNTWANPAVAPNATGTDTGYDALGRVLNTKADSELGTLTTTYEYLAGFQTRVTNPRGFKTTTTYKAYDQPSTDWPMAMTHPEGAYTNFTRDAFGKVTSILRHNADNSDWNRRYISYYPSQEICETTEVETGTTAYGYDGAGNLTWSAAALPWAPDADCDYTENNAYVTPRKVARSYDTRNRLKTLRFPDGLGDQDWTYTPDGLPDTITAYNGTGQTVPVVTAYSYNKRRLLGGQGETVTQPQWYTWGIGYGYDANGNLASHVYPSGLTVNYAPNALGQPTQAGTFATNVSYHPNGAIKQFTYGNGFTHTLTQNLRGLPLVSCDFFSSCPASVMLNDRYLYDANGNVAAIADDRASHASDRVMTYDGLDRLKSVDSPMYGTHDANYQYDTLDNLTYVLIGGAAIRQHWYCYDDHNQLTNVKTGPCDTGASVIGLGYDERGNLANKNGVAFVFDTGNRLREVTGVEYYRYDGLGRRVHAWSPNQTNSNILSQYSQAGQLMYQRNGRSGLAYDYVYLNGSLVAIREQALAGGAYSAKYQHTDALGSPVAVTDANKAILETSQYEPFGFVLNHPPKDGPGYTGHVLDAMTGMNYMQQRYYDPRIGRFLSVDPIDAFSPGGTFNRYWYANNNPYRFTDPDGRYVCSGDKKQCAAVRDGLKAVQDGIKNSSSDAARSTLNAILKFYGKEGVKNGVTIKFNSGIGMANAQTVRGQTTISVNLNKINYLAEQRGTPINAAIGSTMMHEGQHGMEKRAPMSRSEEKAQEIRGARAEAYGWEATQANSWWQTWTKSGGINEGAIEIEAEAATKAWCASGGNCK